MTNDPRNKDITLTIKGKVDKFADISTRLIRFDGPADKTMKTGVTIRPDKKYPFKITKAYARSGTNITLELSELQGDKGYRLDVKNTKTDPGTYVDYIYLKTDSKVNPTLTIRVRGAIFKAQNAE